jgi:hypothetical protein
LGRSIRVKALIRPEGQRHDIFGRVNSEASLLDRPKYIGFQPVTKVNMPLAIFTLTPNRRNFRTGRKRLGNQQLSRAKADLANVPTNRAADSSVTGSAARLFSEGVM